LKFVLLDQVLSVILGHKNISIERFRDSNIRLALRILSEDFGLSFALFRLISTMLSSSRTSQTSLVELSWPLSFHKMALLRPDGKSTL